MLFIGCSFVFVLLVSYWYKAVLLMMYFMLCTGIAVTSLFGVGYLLCLLIFLLSVPELVEMQIFFTESLHVRTP